MTFGEAIEAMKDGKKVAREGWNGKGMFLVLAKNIEFDTDTDLGPEARPYPIGESVAMKTAGNTWCVGWLASQADMLSEDWVIVA